MTALDLQRDPFSREPDSLFFYSFDGNEQRISILDGLVKGSDLFVLVIGDPGSGKTTLLNHYLASIESEWEWTSARIPVDLDPGKFGPVSPEQPVQREYPVYVLHKSAEPVVIVDDAHRLSEKQLEFLIEEAKVPGSQNKIKRLVLFGESELHIAVTKLAATLSAHPPVNKIYLPGLTEKQTADYLRHRLESAGYAGEFPFDADTIKTIHQNAGGYPGPINGFAQQWLVDKYSSKQEGQHMSKKISFGSRRTVIWICAGVIILLLASTWYFSDRRPSTSLAGDQKPTKTVVRKKITQPVKKIDRLVAQKAKVVPPPVTTPQPLKTDQPQKAQPVLHEPVEKDLPDESVRTQPEPTQKSISPSSIPPIEVATGDSRETPSAPATAAQPKKEQPPERVQQPGAEPPPQKPVRVMAKAKAREIHREEWLLSQDGESYTIQIIGVSSEALMLDFIKRNQLLKQNEIAYYQTTFQGKPWYQALYGIYPSGREARMAAEKLPDNIRRAGPWIRKLSGVQKAIAK
jgi:DamX protein